MIYRKKKRYMAIDTLCIIKRIELINKRKYKDAVLYKNIYSH